MGGQSMRRTVLSTAPKGRTEFSRFEMHDIRIAVALLGGGDESERARAHRRLSKLGLRVNDWVRPGNQFDSYQLERRLSAGDIRVVEGTSPSASPPQQARTFTPSPASSSAEAAEPP